MTDYLILHYEDEPHRVDLPGTLEVALYQHPEVTSSNLTASEDLTRFDFSFRYRGIDHTLRYLIDLSIQNVEEQCGVPVEQALFHLIDLHIGADNEAGVKIVDALRKLKVSSDRIWMVTAYEGVARIDQRLSGITIYPKPSPLWEMVDAILGRMLGTGR